MASWQNRCYERASHPAFDAQEPIQAVLLLSMDESAHDQQSQQIRELTGNMPVSSLMFASTVVALVPLRKPATNRIYARSI
jgi:hypothetical protein